MLLALKDGRGESKTKKQRKLLEAGKGKEVDFP